MSFHVAQDANAVIDVEVGVEPDHPLHGQPGVPHLLKHVDS